MEGINNVGMRFLGACEKMNHANYKNILVISLRKIGDTIIATSGVYLLKKAFPKAKITMLVKPLTQQIVQNNPIIDEVLIYDYKHQGAFSEMLQIANKLRAHKYDLCIVLDNKPRSAMIAWMAGIHKRVGFENITFRNIYLNLFYTDIIKIDYDSSHTLQVKNHEIFINRFTGRNDVAKMVMSDISEQSKGKLDDIFSKLVKETNCDLKIALCIRSGCLTKDWSLEKFKEVVKCLSDTYNAVFYIVGPQSDVTIVEEFIGDSGAVPIYNLCGKTTLPELAYVLKKSDFFLSVDTGSAHIAASVDTPMVVVFGATSPEKWGPYSEKVICLKPEYNCHPCDDRKVSCDNPKCLDTVTIDDVVNACKQQLDKYPRAKLLNIDKLERS